MMRALILTNQFYHFAGSEMVALELAEELRRRGWTVHLFANEISGELRDLLIASDVTPEDALPDIDLFSFDLVVSQHHLLPLILCEALNREVTPKKWPFFAFSHLSPYDPAEVPGPFIERHFADLIMANSLETAQTLADYGPPFDQVNIFANPAPLEFSDDPTEPAEALQSLLVVSNHRNKDIAQAIKIVAKSGVRVTRVGRKQVPQRVNADMIKKHDAVLTIGKTVQYALRSKRPVFCYDRFAGPGWLNAENMEQAAWFNFSGRDTQIDRSPETLAADIINGYREARSYAIGLAPSDLRPYSLESRVGDIVDMVAATRNDQARHDALTALFAKPSMQAMIRHEARLVAIYRKEFLHRRALDMKITRFKNLFRPLRMAPWRR